MIEVIAAAARKAILRDGYAFSSGLGCPLAEGIDGGMCARCSRHNVVLFDNQQMSLRLTIENTY